MVNEGCGQTGPLVVGGTSGYRGTADRLPATTIASCARSLIMDAREILVPAARSRANSSLDHCADRVEAQRFPPDRGFERFPGGVTSWP